MKKRILVFDQVEYRPAACKEAFGTRADVVVYNESGLPQWRWDLVLLHKREKADFTTARIQYGECLLYDGGGVPEGIPRPIDSQGINTEEAARIVSVLESFPEDQWGWRLKDIWAGVPEGILLAALMLQVGQELPEDLREIADSEYHSHRKSIPAGIVQYERLDKNNRLGAYKALINAARRRSGH